MNNPNEIIVNAPKKDTDIMFDALFSIIANDEINTVEKCIKIAGDAIDAVLNQN